MSRQRIFITSTIVFSLGVFLSTNTAFAQFSRSQISPRGGDYAPRPRGGGFYGGYGGGFGIPIIIPTPNPRYYEPDDEDVIYERPRRRARPQRNVPPIDIDSVDDYPPQNVHRAKQQKHKPQREIVRAPQKTKTVKAVQAPKTPRVPVPPVIAAKPPLQSPISAGVPPITETRYVSNEVVFEFKSNASPASIDQVIAANRLERIASWKFKLTDSILYRYRITDGRSVSVVIAALEQNSNISSAQPNYIYALQQAAPQPVSKVSNTSLPPQYVVEIMHVTEAHKLAKGKNVLISVIDSAIDKDHPELLGTVTDSFDPIGGTAKPDSHGTAMSGALAAHGQLAGIAPDSKIIAVRAFAGKNEPAETTQSGAQGTSFHVLRGLDWSYEKNARIVNMSFAGPKDPALSRMIAAAKDKRMVIIAAAGNAGITSAPLYPAADPNVIAVAATDNESKLYIQSNRGAYVSVAAPGVDILVAAPNGAYDFSTGTSVATAHVSGVAALILQKQPNLDSEGVRKALKSTAIGLKSGDKPDTGKIDTGVVDALAALKAIGHD
jgi:subtilisin family serine protease